VHDALHDALGLFVSSGVPGAADLPTWPAYSREWAPTIIFDARKRVENDLHAEQPSGLQAAWLDAVRLA
jgi:carboxylesterase type B